MNLAIHRQHVLLPKEAREYLLRRLEFALDRLADRIHRIEVFVADVNGPRGGIDKKCRVVAYLSGTHPICVEGCSNQWEPLFSQVAHRLAYAVRRQLDRRREGRHS